MNAAVSVPSTPVVRSFRWRSLEFILGAMLTGSMLALVLTSVWVFPDRGSAMDLAARLTAPFTTWAHPLGTDPLGRDVLARVLVGKTRLTSAASTSSFLVLAVPCRLM